ncbi:MAG: tetratricopeptide repeat protein, partial [Candidatus Thorarchaeota archaeon]
MEQSGYYNFENAYIEGRFYEVIKIIESTGDQDYQNFFYYYISSAIELGLLDKADQLLLELEPVRIDSGYMLTFKFLRGKYYNSLEQYQLAINELNYAYKYCKKDLQQFFYIEIVVQLGYAYRGINDYNKAIELTLVLIPLINKYTNVGLIAQIYLLLGILYLETNIISDGINFLKKALKFFEEINHSFGKALIFFHLSSSYNQQQQTQKAIYFGERALTIFQHVNNRFYIALSSINLAEINFALNKSQEAIQLLQSAQNVAEKIGYPYYYALALNKMSDVYKNLRKYRKAINYIQKALTVLEIQDNQYLIAVTLFKFGIILNLQKKYDDSLEIFRRSLNHFEQLHDLDFISKILIKIGETKIQQKKYSEALQIFTDLLATITFSKDPCMYCSILFYISWMKHKINILDLKFSLESDCLHRSLPNFSKKCQFSGSIIRGIYYFHQNELDQA